MWTKMTDRSVWMHKVIRGPWDTLHSVGFYMPGPQCLHLSGHIPGHCMDKHFSGSVGSLGINKIHCQGKSSELRFGNIYMILCIVMWT